MEEINQNIYLVQIDIQVSVKEIYNILTTAYHVVAWFYKQIKLELQVIKTKHGWNFIFKKKKKKKKEGLRRPTFRNENSIRQNAN